ncbi:MAG: glycosyltransferase family 2 protein [Nitrospirae bacterium]|nr:glycosyltransferase family 2 protein [Nitrospirota bacterium]MBF0533462.1 glycosyltransferase family 2 protein [Nitrospirota bacterium]MBF0616014.1 glycosyltransferase family 2 protein [Nitrospirota bacterium]
MQNSVKNVLDKRAHLLLFCKTVVEEKLGITIITYNRASYLDETLRQLLSSPFKDCKITVLDNCSPDDTPVVCEKYSHLFRNIAIFRHKHNIGGAGNYARAVEISDMEYTWILCDDDTFDFTEVSDVIGAIIYGTYDIIIVGSPGLFDTQRGIRGNPMDLIKQGIYYYYVLSFIPGFIYRTEKYDSQCLIENYKFFPYSYPHFAIIDKSVRENFTVYVSEQLIVIRNLLGASPITLLSWYRHWIYCCSIIHDPKLRELTMASPFKQQGGYRFLMMFIGHGKIFNKGTFYKDMLTIFVRFSWKLRLISLPMIFIPRPVYIVMRHIYRFVQEKIFKITPAPLVIDKSRG